MDIQQASQDDIEAIVHLFKAYNFALTDARWLQWKYFENPVGQAAMYKILHRSALVGAVAIIPQLFYSAGRTIVGLQTVDGLLGKEIRGKGFFNELMHFLSTQRPESVSGDYFYLSFPSLAASIKAHENAGWRRLANFRLRKVLLNPEPLFRERRMAAVGKGLSLLWRAGIRQWMLAAPRSLTTREITGPPPDYNVYLPPDRVVGDRASAFMNWRVATNPRDRMKIVEVMDDGVPIGYAACKIVGRCVEITENRSIPKAEQHFQRALLRYINMRQWGDSVDFWSLGEHAADEQPLRGAFSRPFSGALFVNSHRRCGLPDSPDAWAITYLDSDW